MTSADKKKKVLLYNPAIGTMNEGDHIIFDSIMRQMKELFPDSNFYELPTQMPVSKRVLKWFKDIDLRFVCGTNLLKNNMLVEWGRYRPYFRGIRQWDINLKSRSLYGPVILMGCGWQKYQDGKDIFSEKLWQLLLDSKYEHSVRDSYTKEKLAEIGIKNVINTGCPTTWELTREHCLAIPENKADNVVTTITDYNKDETRDQRMMDTLSKLYNRVYVWLQGYEDEEYVRRMHLNENITVISGGVFAYDQLLENPNIEFVGTRLHGGIRALQKGRRTTFIAVDNRTIELGSNIGLNYLERKNILELEDYLSEKRSCRVKIPEKEIRRFKEQFGERD